MRECRENELSIANQEPSRIGARKENGSFALEKVKQIVVEVAQRPDKEFIPMVRYRGGVSIQRIRALLSFVLSMKEANVCTTARICKISQESPDLIHIEGLHAPVANCSLYSLFGRLHDNQNFSKTYQGLNEYMGTVRAHASPAAQMMMTHAVTRISWTSTDTKWAWRKVAPKPFAIRQKDAPLFYPFAAPQSKEVQDCELLMAVHGIVPKGLPPQLRGDICQELIVRILSGDATFANIQDDPQKYIYTLMKEHPGRYGPVSLDSKDEDGRSVMDHLGI